jgi:transposase
VAEAEIITRRRKWSPADKAALLAEIEAEGGKVAVVARRHRISESLLYNWRSAWKAAAAAAGAGNVMDFIPLGVIGCTSRAAPAMLAPPEPKRREPPGGEHSPGGIEIALPNGARVRVDARVNERALSRVLRAMKGVM